MRRAVVLITAIIFSPAALDVAQAADASSLAPAEASFAWDGLYGGVTGGYYATGYADVNAVAGINFLPAENFLLGLEGGAGPYFDVGGGFGDGWEAYGAARAGVVADNFLVYGVAGLEAYSWGGSHLFAGAGAEFAASDISSIRVQAVAHSSGDTLVTGGLLFHF
jgi:hypothetical protein